MTAAREEILADLATTLALVTTANGYHQDVVTVERTIGRDPRGIGPGSLPWVGLGPDPERQPAPIWRGTSGRSTEQLFVRMQAVVAAAPGADRQAAVSELARDLVHAVMLDPSRGGWAVSTLPVMGPWADDGAPDMPGSDGRGSIQLVFAILYSVDWAAKSDAQL